MDISHIRKEYQKQQLDREHLKSEPLDQFREWLDAAIAAECPEPNAMVLATATLRGKPASRTVLLKYYDAEGFVFYSNYESRKASELNENPVCCCTFLWHEMARQVTLEGSVTKVSREESVDYFSRRPLRSQLSAWASRQGETLDSRILLENAYQEVENRYSGKEVDCPKYWGGYRIKPLRYEFWLGRPNRLHDRFEYRFNDADGKWIIHRLSP